MDLAGRNGFLDLDLICGMKTLVGKVTGTISYISSDLSQRELAAIELLRMSSFLLRIDWVG